MKLRNIKWSPTGHVSSSRGLQNETVTLYTPSGCTAEVSFSMHVRDIMADYSCLKDLHWLLFEKARTTPLGRSSLEARQWQHQDYACMPISFTASEGEFACDHFYVWLKVVRATKVLRLVLDNRGSDEGLTLVHATLQVQLSVNHETLTSEG